MTNGQPDAELYRLARVDERPHLGGRYAAECLHCLRADPSRTVGHLVAGATREEAIRRMRNHQAQQHDVLTALTSPGSTP